MKDSNWWTLTMLENNKVIEYDNNSLEDLNSYNDCIAEDFLIT